MTPTKAPLVSVIVPCYNVDCFIDRCVKSLLETEYDNKELIFVTTEAPTTHSTSSIVGHTNLLKSK